MKKVYRNTKNVRSLRHEVANITDELIKISKDLKI